MTGTLSISNFPKICLFCLLESTELEPISQTPSVEIFWKVSGVQNICDLPQKICPNCTHVFQSFTMFIKDCLDNFKKLKNLFEATAEKNSSKLELKPENLPQYKCEVCKSKFDSLDNFNSHINKQKCLKHTYDTRQLLPKEECKKSCSPKGFSCSKCGKTFKKKHLLNTHMGCHTKELFKCLECSKGFRFQQNLTRHLLIHKGVKKFTCEYCGKAFSRAHVLKEHKNIHTGNNPYICNYCGKGFKRYANHFIHVHRHKLINGEVDQTEATKLYLQLKCDKCNRIFASRGALQNHLVLHNDSEGQGKNFLCTYCGKDFNTKGQLDSHMRTHTGYSPYECKQCGKKFKQKSAFNNHSVVHSGEKPYQCNLCQKCFTQSGHLKIHMRLHSGEKPFSCSFCRKTFTSNGNLKVHLRTHTGEKPYKCLVCSKAYYNSTSLKKHTKSHSNIERINSDDRDTNSASLPDNL